MKTLHPSHHTSDLVLRNRTAAELMTPNPVSIHRASTIREAAAFLAGRGISAAPVIDEAGRPVGVVSRSDILARHPAADAAWTPIHAVMTPTVFCIRPDAPMAKVVEKMVSLGIRRLFVVDGSDVLIGVISAFDVLRTLRHDSRRTSRR